MKVLIGFPKPKVVGSNPAGRISNDKDFGCAVPPMRDCFNQLGQKSYQRRFVVTIFQLNGYNECPEHFQLRKYFLLTHHKQSDINKIVR